MAGLDELVELRGRLADPRIDGKGRERPGREVVLAGPGAFQLELLDLDSMECLQATLELRGGNPQLTGMQRRAFRVMFSLFVP